MRAPSPSLLRPVKNSEIPDPKRVILIALITLAFVAISYAFCCVWSAQSPFETITLSRKMLHQARMAQATTYAPGIMADAEHNWIKTIDEWHKENKRSRFFRDYTRVNLLAQETIKLARTAERSAKAQKDSLRESVRLESILVRETITKFINRFGELPIEQSLNYKLITSELLLNEGQSALKRDDLFEASRKIKKASQLIGQSDNQLTQIMKDYFLQLPLWKQWAAETIKWSADSQSVAIVVEKIGKRLKIYKNGSLLKEFTAEFGVNWIGHKKLRGDDATPEGHYQIKKKKEGKYTKYYLALEINYPNDRDLERFNRAKLRGDLPMNAQIGGLIEVHGGGGEGRNWTNGCVALKNSDMDTVYRMIQPGTPITIVGALHINPDAFH
jgi:hypothetical protein